MGKIKDLIKLPLHFVRFNPAQSRYSHLKALLWRLFQDTEGLNNAAGVKVHFLGYPDEKVDELRDEEEFCFEYAIALS
jgi:hypothetical protein